MIQTIFILFIILLIYYYTAYPDDSNGWLRALVLSVGIPLLSLLPEYFGFIGWIIALIAVMMLIMNVNRSTFPSAFLFLLIVGISMQVVELFVASLTN